MAKDKIDIHSIDQVEFGVVIKHYSNVNWFVQDEVLNRPHRHDHYTCFMLESGEVELNVDFQNIKIVNMPCMFVSLPGQVHELTHVLNAQGWFVAFDASYVDQEARSIIEEASAHLALLTLNPVDYNWFSTAFKLIESSVETPSQIFQQRLIDTLINGLFLRVVNIFHLQNEEHIRANLLRNGEISRNFQKLANEHYLLLKKPSHYAEMMNITVGYLNDTVKSITGFTSTQIIQNLIIKEARRLIIYTQKNTHEIADYLGFEDHKYFTRFFKKIVGVSPMAFRKNNSKS